MIAGLSRAMRCLSKRYELTHALGAIAKRRRYHRIEVVAHELAHGMVLGLDLRDADMCSKTDTLHAKMSDEVSDKHEIEACAVEWLALRSVGVKIAMERLSETATELARCYGREELRRRMVRATKQHDVRRLAKKMAAFMREEAAR